MDVQEGDIIKMSVAGIPIVAEVIMARGDLRAAVVTPVAHYGIVLFLPQKLEVVESLQEVIIGRCIDKLPHTCGTRKGLQVFEQDDGTIDAYCYNCNTFVADPYHDKPEGYRPAEPIEKSPADIEKELVLISKYPTKGIQERLLTKEALEYFGIVTGLDAATASVATTAFLPYYDDDEALSSYKVRPLDVKNMWSIGNSKKPNLFGWKQALATGAKRLLITEGEFDAVALKIIIDRYCKDGYQDFKPAICSLPKGAGNAYSDLARLSAKIRKHFREIVFVFDQDEAGQKAVEECLKVFPEATVANLPAKDANDCLLTGKEKAAYNAVTFNLAKPKNTRLVWGEDVHESAKEQAQWGLNWPWKKVTEWTRGIRFGETIYIGAAQKMGKSEVVNTLGAHLIKEYGLKILMAKPEESNKKTYKLVAGKIVNRVFHDPKVEFDYDAYEEAGKVLANKLCMVNLYQHLGWESLQGDIRAAAADGCKAVFIDPITNLTNGMDSGTANTKLQEIAQELAAMAKDLDIVIFIFCHLRNPDSGAPHDRGGKVLTSQFAGSRAMGRSCNYMFGLEGNKDPELDEEERNKRILVLLDDREFGEVGECHLYWERKTTHFYEIG